MVPDFSVFPYVIFFLNVEKMKNLLTVGRPLLPSAGRTDV